MANDMYLLPFYFVFIDIAEQLGIFNHFFLIINKELKLPTPIGVLNLEKSIL